MTHLRFLLVQFQRQITQHQSFAFIDEKSQMDATFVFTHYLISK